VSRAGRHEQLRAGNGPVTVPAGFLSEVAVVTGPRLLSGLEDGPAIGAHRRYWPEPEPVPPGELLELLARVELRGRGGAGFPFARKFRATLRAGRRRAVVVNAAESDPSSAKDSVLMLRAPHLVLDGAHLVARALKVRRVHLVVPAERKAVLPEVEAAVRQREDEGIDHRVHVADGGFTGGQDRAVLELLEGRANLPATAHRPPAVRGLGGRPTLLSNAETFAQVAVAAALGPHEFRRLGTETEPGTTLLTVGGDGEHGIVLEVPLGTAMGEVLAHLGYESGSNLLVGGYHGTWLPARRTLRGRVSHLDLAESGAVLGPGAILPVAGDACPVRLTARIVDFLASGTVRGCGPCRLGLAELAEAIARFADVGGLSAGNRIRQLLPLVVGRGACSHPDATARLVRSLFTAFPEEIALHEEGRCAVTGDARGSELFRSVSRSARGDDEAGPWTGQDGDSPYGGPDAGDPAYGAQAPRRARTGPGRRRFRR